MARYFRGGRLAAYGLLAIAGAMGVPSTQAEQPVVYVITIDGVIDLGIAPFLDRTISEARKAGASAVALEINTFGGRLDAAVVMRDTLLQSPIRTVAFINRRAISAGALIALACETIVMAEGATIGAATPVLAGGGETRPTDEKTVSYVRKEFRSTAEFRKRPPAFAEAMVDADVEIKDVIAKGKLLTLTTAEALQYKVADHRASSVEAALAAAGLPNAIIQRAQQSWAESIVRFLTNPILSSLLMTIGLLGLFVEIRTPGFGIPGIIGLTSLGLFFWGHWIVKLAGWEEMLLVFIGVLLIALEIFVIPGFSVAGILGIVALVAGLGLTLVGAGATATLIVTALGRVAFSLLVAMAGAFALLRFLPKLPFAHQLVLGTGMAADQGYVSPPESDRLWLGKTGMALSALRPSGIAHIEGHRVDVVSEGEFIEAQTPIKVSRVDGNRIVVRQLPTHQENKNE